MLTQRDLILLEAALAQPPRRLAPLVGLWQPPRKLSDVARSVAVARAHEASLWRTNAAENAPNAFD